MLQETRQKIAIGVARSHAEGRFGSSETKLKISAGVKRAQKEGKVMGFQPGNKHGAKVSPEGALKRIRASNRVCLGSHGFGIMKQGRPDHLMAKSWVIKSPGGKTYEISNLLEWCRSNEHLFEKDEVSRRQPLWDRVATGLSGKGQWKGWVMVSRQEIIDRPSAQPSPPSTPPCATEERRSASEEEQTAP